MDDEHGRQRSEKALRFDAADADAEKMNDMHRMLKKLSGPSSASIGLVDYM